MYVTQCNPEKGFLLNHELQALIGAHLPPFLSGNALAVTLEETPETVIVKAVIPGVSKEELSVYAASNYVRIVRETKQSDNYRNEYMFKFEHYETSFTRTIPLQTRVDSRRACGKFAGDVLVVVMPKLPK